MRGTTHFPNRAKYALGFFYVSLKDATLEHKVFISEKTSATCGETLIAFFLIPFYALKICRKFCYTARIRPAPIKNLSLSNSLVGSYAG
jgi:hypothetical protein